MKTLLNNEVKYMYFKNLKLYLSLFRINFSISSFTFGGGYVVIPMMRKYFVTNLNLISEEELLDMAAISQSAPGAIAINLSVIVGYKILGLKGAIISCIASILPPIIILSLISSFYSITRDNTFISAILKGMEAGVSALIIDLLFDMTSTILKEKNTLHILIVPLSFIATFFFNINVAFILLISAILGFSQIRLNRNRGGKGD